MRVASSVFPVVLGIGAVTAAGVAYADRRSEVCQRWAADRVDRSEGTWTGNADTCDPGDVTEPGRTNALKILNLYRFLAEMPEVTSDPARNAKAQQCALMQSVNGSLSHTPPTTWKCYTADGAEASGKSNITSAKGVAAMDGYMTDRNVAQMGHRRWALANSLGPIGLGSASKGSCFWNLDGTGKAGKPFVAWPPIGPVPADVFRVNSLDTAGWTIQSDSINLDTATVTITDAGQDRPVTVVVLPPNYGSRYALKLTPNGWTSQAGHVYAVSLQGTSMPVAYTVEVVDCTTVDGGTSGTGGAGGTSGGIDAGGAGRAGASGAAGAGGTSGGMDAGAAGRAGASGAGGAGASGGAGGSGPSAGAGGGGASAGAGGGGSTGTGTGGFAGASTGGGGKGGAGNPPPGAGGGVGVGGSGTGTGDPTTGTGGGAAGRSGGGGPEDVGACACTTPGTRRHSFPLPFGLITAVAAMALARRRRQGRS
jgi:hypothetical protein